MKKQIAILGGGPSGLFVFKRLIESGEADFVVHIFEATDHLGAGMPYSERGANPEHVTNVSGNEIPTLVTPLKDWLATLSPEIVQKFDFRLDRIVDYRVVPRLLFGAYLSAQFELLKQIADALGIETVLHLNCRVVDIKEATASVRIELQIAEQDSFSCDCLIVCTGHHWPLKKEKRVPGFFDSPYPPKKLKDIKNHPVAVRGSSLTAIDAIRTLSRNNGAFLEDEAGAISFEPHENAPEFKIVMHSREGLLPAIRFHLDDPHLSKQSLLTEVELKRHREENGGFISLDFIFEKDFKDSFRDKDPKFYQLITSMSIEEFVEAMMKLREESDAFSLFRAEYVEARQSIRRKESIYWKEMLAVLSFAINYPAKHFSAEDMLRLQKVLMPLISVVIAFAPQRSCEEMLALHAKGKLELVSVGSQSQVEVHSQGGITYSYYDESGEKREVTYQSFVDCVGQPHLSIEDFPFKTLLKSGAVDSARIKFKSPSSAIKARNEGQKDIEENADGEFFLKVPGIAINDHFQIINTRGESNPQIYFMAVPFIGGFNPDYSGLDFCEEASERVVSAIFRGKH